MRRCTLLFALLASVSAAQQNRGYYRYPAIHGNRVVFTAEGDLWQVDLTGGAARRLTSHPGEEDHAAFSPDGQTIAFTGSYEGSPDVYTMPADGGLPIRRTFGGGLVNGWTPDGRLIFSTYRYSTLPNVQLLIADKDNRIEPIPLHEASQGCYDSTGKTLFFTRMPFQGSHAKRYQGGTAQNLWKFTAGSEALPLTPDYPGTSKDAMYWKGRIYFVSDRDGTMNLWSMDETGKKLKQHTRHQGWDVKTPALDGGRIVYQLGADLRIYDIAADTDKPIAIQLPSDFDNLRERWIKNPLDYTTSVHLSPDGSSAIFTSRGRVFVIPAKAGRLVDATARKPGRYRDARMMPDGKSLVTLSTDSGEVEVWKLPANGAGPGERLTTNGQVLRWEAISSPDGKWIAHQDKNAEMWLLDTSTKADKKIAVAEYGSNSRPKFGNLKWSPDGQWLAFEREAANGFGQIWLYSIATGNLTPLTTNRYNSGDPVWSADGKWLYFLSDRSLKSVIPSPWGSRQPDPFFDKTEKVYSIALKKDLRSPFDPPDELHPAAKPEDAPKTPKVDIDLDGISARLQEVPVPPGNYTSLAITAKRLCWVNRDRSNPEKSALECIDIDNKGDKPESLMEGVADFEMSADGKKMLVGKQKDFFIFDSAIKEAAAKLPKTLADAKLDLKDWNFSVIPTDEYKEALQDAWRLHRDYFYDRGMHGVDWKAMRNKYGELIGRVRDREELNDLVAQMISELSALHASVRGGDLRTGTDQINVATLGAELIRDQSAGGYVIRHIYRSDPDRPDRRSPLARPGVNAHDGDVIVSINGRDVLSVTDPGELLRNQTGKQALLRLKTNDRTQTRDIVVKTLSSLEDFDLRYHEWEFTRRLETEKAGNGQIGYVHLRAMGPNDIAQWNEEYSPIFNRAGLIIDVRHNGGGNIDSWILGKLLRKAWMYWQPRVGSSSWNMQGAFRGHMVVLCDERTGSDGEAFVEGFRRLGLGKAIGTRTWGGEIWLTQSNVLADKGVATAAENGVYGPEGKWLIEGHGVDPDIVVDNLPNATFRGEDAQLQAAIRYLQRLIKEKPVTVPPPPKYPDKTWKGGRPLTVDK